MKDTPNIVIVGSGAAGLIAALTLAPRKVIVISEKTLDGDCASKWSQGGIAAAVGAENSVESHAADTIKAAAGTADTGVVRALTAEAPKYVALLEKYGVKFERGADGHFMLSREACHARRRVLKAEAGDGFGRELMRALVEAVHNTPSIIFAAGLSAEKLIVSDVPLSPYSWGEGRGEGSIHGNQLRDSGTAPHPGPLPTSAGRGRRVSGLVARRVADGRPVVFAASAVLLATGGLGGLYACTTNPAHAVGRGIALAARAGAVLSDLEFVQFHPTALDIGEDPAPLATEALRGEGAWLVNSRGVRFMPDYHEMAELAPRDVVSRAIFAEMQRGQKVYLDCRRIDVSKFPTLIAACARGGFDPQRDMIPVTPAAHYHMGGVATDLNGRASVAGLWAAGEVASTGLHGANRLASNSIMEAVIMGARAAGDIAQSPMKTVRVELTEPTLAPARDMPAEREEIRHVMSDGVGVIRDANGLKNAIITLRAIEAHAEGRDAKTADMALVARLIAEAALARTESRGAHCRSDYPETSKAWQRRSFTTPAPVHALAERVG